MQKAFDLIVERLEEKEQHYRNLSTHDKATWQNRWCIVSNQCAWAVKDAIEIVNQVAEEYKQEVCEWKGKDMLGLYNSSCRQKSIVNPFWTHCPYCGKRIKVIE